jgi:hypothetical protein
MDEAVDNEQLADLLKEASGALGSGQRAEALHALLDIRDFGVVHRGLDEAIEWLRDDPEVPRRDALMAWLERATRSVQSEDVSGPLTPSAWLDGGSSGGLASGSSAAVEFEEVSDDELEADDESEFEPVDFDVDAFESGGFDSGFFEQDEFSQGPFSSQPPLEDDRREIEKGSGEAETTAERTDDDLSFELVDGDDGFDFGEELSEASEGESVEFDPFDDMSADPSDDEGEDDDWRQRDSVDVDSDAETAVPDFKEAQQYGADMMAGFSDGDDDADETAEGRTSGSSAGPSGPPHSKETAEAAQPDEIEETEETSEESEDSDPMGLDDLFGDSLFEESDPVDEEPDEEDDNVPPGFTESSQPTKVADSDSIELALRNDGMGGGGIGGDDAEGPDRTFQGMGTRPQEEDDADAESEREGDIESETTENELGDEEDSENRYREPTPFQGHDAIGTEESEPTREHEIPEEAAPTNATMTGPPASATDKEPLDERADDEFSGSSDTPGKQAQDSEFDDEEHTQAVDPLDDDEFFRLVESIADGEEGDTDRTRQGRPAYRGEPIVEEDEQDDGDAADSGAVGFEDSEVTAGSEDAPDDFATRGPGNDFAADTGASDLSTGAVRLINEAEGLYEDGRYESAKDLVSSVLENHPDSDRAKELLANIEDAKGHTDPTEQLGGLNQVPQREVPMSRVSSLDLDHRAGFVLSLVDGEVTFADILDLSSMSREETLDVLIDMYEADVISVD